MTDPTRADVLAPCPWCGEVPQVHSRNMGHANDPDVKFHIGCCYAILYRSTEAEAIAAWNRRTLTSEAEDAARYRWLRDGCRNVRSAEAMERILANWMEWTPLEGDMAIDAERP